jgi:hypothetical protein
VKLSLLFLRIARSSLSFLLERFVPIITFLSRRVSSRGADLVSYSSFKLVCPWGMSRGLGGWLSLDYKEFMFL